MKRKTRLTIAREAVRDLLGLKRRSKILKIDDSSLFFRDGWGNLDALERLKQTRILELEPKRLDISWLPPFSEKGLIRKDGSFSSPLPHEFLPEEARTAHFRLNLPEDHDRETPIVIVFPMTGDEGFELRERKISRPLLKKGIGTLLLENPFYGKRKPSYQDTYFIQSVLDMLSMCMGAAIEGQHLLSHFQDEGYRHLGVAGQSQGGMVASIVGTLTSSPISIAISLSAHSPEVILTEGLLRSFVDWSQLSMDSLDECHSRFRDIFEVGDILKRPPPAYPQAAFIQGARLDKVTPRASVRSIHEHWAGSQLEWLPGSHISSLTLHSKDFVDLISKSVQALKAKKE